MYVCICAVVLPQILCIIILSYRSECPPSQILVLPTLWVRDLTLESPRYSLNYDMWKLHWTYKVSDLEHGESCEYCTVSYRINGFQWGFRALRRPWRYLALLCYLQMFADSEFSYVNSPRIRSTCCIHKSYLDNKKQTASKFLLYCAKAESSCDATSFRLVCEGTACVCGPGRE